MKNIKWSDSPREELKYIDEMIALGFEVRFSYHDEQAGRITPDNPPTLGINYVKNDLVIWLLISGKWQTAYSIKSGYNKHKSFSTILEATERNTFLK